MVVVDGGGGGWSEREGGGGLRGRGTVKGMASEETGRREFCKVCKLIV